MTPTVSDYAPQTIEKKWQQRWAESRAFEVSAEPSKPKFYCLVMFAYPSGHAHVGHVRNYMIGDVVARMQGLESSPVAAFTPVGTSTARIGRPDAPASEVTAAAIPSGGPVRP